MIVDNIRKIQTIGLTELLRQIHMKKNVSTSYPMDQCHGFFPISRYTHAAFGDLIEIRSCIHDESMTLVFCLWLQTIG
jgi:hypothetical protein